MFNIIIALVKHTRVVTSSTSNASSAGNEQAMETEDSALALLAQQVSNVVNGM